MKTSKSTSDLTSGLEPASGSRSLPLESPADIAHALDEFAHDALDGDARDVVAALIASEPRYQAHNDAALELGSLLRATFDAAHDAAPMAGISARVIDAIGATPARDAELEMLAMAAFDGEAITASDQLELDTYMTTHPAARAALDGLHELRELTRAPSERAADQVNFEALSRRVMRAVTESEAKTNATSSGAAGSAKESRSFGALFREWFSTPGVGIAGLAGAAVCAMVVLPVALLTTGQQNESLGPQVVNNYYVSPSTAVDAVRYDQGFSGSVKEGNDINAPVVWIEQVPDEATEDDGPATEAPPTPPRGI